jgi:hypothetical protein
LPLATPAAVFACIPPPHAWRRLQVTRHTLAQHTCRNTRQAAGCSRRGAASALRDREPWASCRT